jgi:hypothetical protein
MPSCSTTSSLPSSSSWTDHPGLIDTHVPASRVPGRPRLAILTPSNTTNTSLPSFHPSILHSLTLGSLGGKNVAARRVYSFINRTWCLSSPRAMGRWRLRARRSLAHNPSGKLNPAGDADRQHERRQGRGGAYHLTRRAFSWHAPRRPSRGRWCVGAGGRLNAFTRCRLLNTH